MFPPDETLEQALARAIAERAVPGELFVSWSDMHGLHGGTTYQLVPGLQIERARRGAAPIEELGVCRAEPEAVVELLGILRDIRVWEAALPARPPVPDETTFGAHVQIGRLRAGLLELAPATERTSRVRAWFERNAPLLAPLAALTPVPKLPVLHESDLTGFYDRFYGITLEAAMDRLLDPAKLDARCAGSGWTALHLPTNVAHPELVRHRGRPFEKLLGVAKDDLLAILYGSSTDDARGFVVLDEGKVRTCSLDEADERRAGGATIGTRAAALAVLLQRADDPRAPWMCPSVIPLPPREMHDDAVRAALTKLEVHVERYARLAAISAPEAILENEAGLLQSAFDALYDAVVERLEEISEGR